MSLRACVAAVQGRRKIASRSATIAAAIFTTYVVLLLAVSIPSAPRNLRLGEQECFGDWCASVVQAEQEGGAVSVILRTDNRRQNSAVRPQSPRVQILDTAGRAAALVTVPTPALDAPVPPGESVTRQLVFSTPPGASELHLEITEGPWFSSLLIGSPNAPFHNRPRVRIE